MANPEQVKELWRIATDSVTLAVGFDPKTHGTRLVSNKQFYSTSTNEMGYTFTVLIKQPYDFQRAKQEVSNEGVNHSGVVTEFRLLKELLTIPDKNMDDNTKSSVDEPVVSRDGDRSTSQKMWKHG